MNALGLAATTNPIRCATHPVARPCRVRSRLRGLAVDIDKFWARVDPNGPVPEYRPDLGPCWLWTGNLTDGYGRFSAEDRMWPAHRWAYATFVGEPPAELVMDHLCRVRACVNPSHLEPVTNAENLRRGFGTSIARAAKGEKQAANREARRLAVVLRDISTVEETARRSHCRKGHEFTPENTYRDVRGDRNCRTCRNAGRVWSDRDRERQRVYTARKRAARLAAPLPENPR